MSINTNGRSTTARGREQWEEYQSVTGKDMIQYDFRANDGRLFSCVAPTLEEARRRRNEWETEQPAKIVPERLKTIYWIDVIKSAEVYINTLAAYGFVDDDAENYIFETVIKAVYGKNIFDWINKQRP